MRLRLCKICGTKAKVTPSMMLRYSLITLASDRKK